LEVEKRKQLKKLEVEKRKQLKLQRKELEEQERRNRCKNASEFKDMDEALDWLLDM